VHLAPRAYLTLYRASPAIGDSTKLSLPKLDIFFPTLRTLISKPTNLPGATIAILCLAPAGLSWTAYTSVEPSLGTRPSFSLAGDGATLDFVLPQSDTQAISSASERPIWCLDFTDGGRRRGIVMSQSRMRDIESVLNPMSAVDSMAGVNIGMIGAETGSWVDLLVCPAFNSSDKIHNLINCWLEVNLAAPEVSTEYYTASYVSRSP
jgi:hypothetical protein